MQKLQKTTHPATHAWVLRTAAGLVFVFAGFAAFQMVSAQTSPPCDPRTNPGLCNPSRPLLLTASTTQVVESNLNIGTNTPGGNRTLGIYGTINLYDGSKLQTVAPFTGQAINVTSTGNHAIVGTSNVAGKAGVYGLGNGVATDNYGVVAYGTGGPALYAEGAIAAKLMVKVTLTDGSSSATLSFLSGNLNIQTSVANKILTLNSRAAGGGSMQRAIKEDNLAPGATRTNVIKDTLLFGQYEVTSIQVLYDDKSTSDIWWTPLPQANSPYTECAGSLFTGRLDLTNPFAFSVDLRVIVTFDPQATFSCPGQDGAAPTNVIVNLPSTGQTGYYCTDPAACPTNWQSGSAISMSASASDNVGVTSVEYFVTVNGVTTSLGSVLTTTSSTWVKTLNTTVAPFANSCSGTFNFSGVCSVALTSYVITAKATDAANNVSLASPGKPIYVTNGQQSKVPCNGTNGSIVCDAGSCGVFSGTPSCAL